MRARIHRYVITGLVPVIPMAEAQRSPNRDGRDKPGHDAVGVMGRPYPIEPPPPCPPRKGEDKERQRPHMFT
ncbi:hypothetical protein J4G37_06370 [Microvirga sp. 3-52]|nr:hypothetical protein [Microvirga sp. 3-52]